MKLLEKLKVLVALLISLFILNNEIINAQTTETWEKVYSSTGYDVGNKVLETPDGGYVSVGYSNDNNKNDLLLIKTNENGEPEWINLVHVQNKDQKANDAILTVNGTILIIGSTKNCNNGAKANILLQEYDLSGSVIWSKTILSSNTQEGLAIVKNPNGGYFISGSEMLDGWQDDFGFVKSIDANGNQLWSRSTSGQSTDLVFDGNNIVAIGNATTMFGDRDTYVKAWNQNGDAIWNKVMSNNSENRNNSIVAVSDGYLITGYVSNNFGVNNKDLSVVKLNLNGTQAWSKTYGGIYNEIGYAISETQDGNFVIAGSSEDDLNASNNEKYILKISNTGNVIWEQMFDQATTAIKKDRVFDIIEKSNGAGFLLTGKTVDFTRSSSEDLFLTKLSSSGDLMDEIAFEDLVRMASSAGKTETSIVETTNVDIANDRNLSIQLYDMTGKMIVQERNSAEALRNLQNKLVTGMYVYKIIGNQNEVLKCGKLNIN